MTAVDFTLELFCRVDEALATQHKHPLALLHPSEVVTIGLLYALRGGSFRHFYRWLERELASLFPRLPERSRLSRLLQRSASWTQRFLAQPSFFGALDCYGIDLLHPRRAKSLFTCGGRPRFARYGKSNSKWIAGAKLALCVNSSGQVVSWDVAEANVSDLHFLPLAHALQGQSVLLADKGFWLSGKSKKAKGHKRLGRTRPSNVLICERGRWNERQLIERVLALFTQVFHLKRLTQRTRQGVVTRLAFAMAAFNLLCTWNTQPCLQIAHLAL